MRCKEFELKSSVYLDRRLGEREATECRAHLSTCDACRAHLAETERVSLMLRQTGRLEIPRELHNYIMGTVARRAARDVSLGRRIYEWLLTLNPRPISYAVGLVMSAFLFTIFLSVIKPIPSIGPRVEQMAIFPIITGSDGEYHIYNDIPPHAGLANSEHFYQLPRVLDNSALASFSLYHKPGNEGMAALVEVEPDGRAKLVDVLGGQDDPYLIEQLWWSLGTQTFQPAIVEGRAVPTRIVFLVEKVDISG